MTFLLNESILSSRESSGNARQFSHRWLVPTVVVGAAIILIVAGFYSLLGAWYANLGVIQQTRSELSTYDAANFDNPTLDEVRQQIDLSQAITNFERALRWDAENRTALQRLAQLSLSLGDYPFALTLMQDAWDFGNRDEITRLLLGDALAAQGRPESAAVIVSGLPRAAGRLNTQAWYRYYRQADYERAAFAWQAVLLLDPTNTQALNGLQAIPQP